MKLVVDIEESKAIAVLNYKISNCEGSQYILTSCDRRKMEINRN